jgi:hypothetical protein
LVPARPFQGGANQVYLEPLHCVFEIDRSRLFGRQPVQAFDLGHQREDNLSQVLKVRIQWHFMNGSGKTRLRKILTG